MRQLVTTVDVPPHTRVAVYPVEVMSDEAEFDDTYAMRVYREGDSGRIHTSRDRHLPREVVQGVSGVLSLKSLARTRIGGLPTLAMFANEPDASHRANCRLVFPTTARATLELGEVLLGYLETTIAVSKGDPLTWCYGPAEGHRAYPTSCESLSSSE